MFTLVLLLFLFLLREPLRRFSNNFKTIVMIFQTFFMTFQTIFICFSIILQLFKNFFVHLSKRFLVRSKHFGIRVYGITHRLNSGTSEYACHRIYYLSLPYTSYSITPLSSDFNVLSKIQQDISIFIYFFFRIS